MRKMRIISAMLVVLLGSGIVMADFGDNFDRADGALGNGWVISAEGNGGGGALPVAMIASNQLRLDRSGWGSAFLTVSHSTGGLVESIQGDFTVPALASTTDALEFKATNSVTGAYLMVAMYNFSESSRLYFTSSNDGVMNGWNHFYPAAANGPNPGTLTVSLTAADDGSVSMTALDAGGSIYTEWSGTNSGLVGQGGFDTLEVRAYWGTSTVGDTPMYIDNIVATVPEPMTLTLLAMGGLGVLRRRR